MVIAPWKRPRDSLRLVSYGKKTTNEIEKMISFIVLCPRREVFPYGLVVAGWVAGTSIRSLPFAANVSTLVTRAVADGPVYPGIR